MKHHSWEVTSGVFSQSFSYMSRVLPCHSFSRDLSLSIPPSPILFLCLSSLFSLFPSGGQVVIKQNNSQPIRKLARKKFERPIYCNNFENLWWRPRRLCYRSRLRYEKRCFFKRRKNFCCRLRKQIYLFFFHYFFRTMLVHEYLLNIS